MRIELFRGGWRGSKSCRLSGIEKFEEDERILYSIFSVILSM